MELSGSKAFRYFMKCHPGSLLAAARNTGLEVTQKDFVKLEKKLKNRDEVLNAVLDGLKGQTGGRSAEFHRMTNALDRFVSAPEEPGTQEKNALSLQLAQFVMTEGNPNNPGYQWGTSMLAAKALKAMLPKKDFNTFLLQANLNRPRDAQLVPGELDAFVMPRDASRKSGPVPGRNNYDR